jgi:hypothetical protein
MLFLAHNVHTMFWEHSFAESWCSQGFHALFVKHYVLLFTPYVMALAERNFDSTRC